MKDEQLILANFSRPQGGIGFRHFLPESGEERNPNNPVNPVKNMNYIDSSL
jgi:hypothetical protein